VGRRVTLKDIADEAGVSVMTVSNSLNGKHGRASKATIERIRQIAERRGYIADASARSLAAASSQLIGLLVPAEHDATVALSPYNVAVFGLLERELRDRGYHLLFRGVSTAEEVHIALRSWSLDGAILLGFTDRVVETIEPPARTPIVALDSYAVASQAIALRSNDFAGGRIAAQHLLEQGHERVVFAAPDFDSTGVVRERFMGFCAAFEAAGRVWDPSDREIAESTYADGLRIGRALPQAHRAATAVFCTADALAVGVMEGFREAGGTVPDQLSVIGFDNLEIDDYVTPKLTSIDQNVYAKAASAAQTLLAAMAGDATPQTSKPIDVRLVQRESTTPPAAGEGGR